MKKAAKKKKASTDPASMSAGEQVAFIKKELGYTTLEKPPRFWLKTKSRRLNGTMGSRKKGIPYGKCIVLAGDYSSGKTMVGTYLCGEGQRDGADIGYVDVENSSDARWAKKMGGLDFGKEIAPGVWEKVALFQPEVGVFGRTKKQNNLLTRLQTAEELLTMAERWMLLQRQLKPQGKRILLVDSTTAIVPEEEMLAGMDKANMRTQLSLPIILNRLTKRWNQVALNTNTLIIYISQIRIDPMAMFGNPERIPGGKGLLFYPSIICQLRRANKGGNVKSPEGNVIGLRSVIKNLKNKAGSGSTEGKSCGFKAMFHKNSWQFMSAKDLKE